jgi:glycosyltransferase involved in cell wall biosynthesis
MLVSAIILMRNEERFAAACLESLLSQVEGNDCEILCVDGMSTDRTAEIVRGYAAKHDCLRLIENPRKIAPAGMNVGIQHARGKYILILGCHAEYAPDYIAQCLEVLNRTGADEVGGYMTTQPGRDTPTGRAIAAATSCRFGVGNSMFRLSGPEQEVDTVPFGMYRREVFDRVGLYDERLVRNQDIEINSRLKRAGGRIVISPRIKLSYFNRATYAGLWRQAYNNGLWNPYTIWLVGGGLSLRHFVPMLFVLSLAILAVGGVFLTPLWFLLAAEMALYAVVAEYFAITLAPAAKASPPRILWAFVTLHLGYGIGSLWGLLTIPFKFPNRKAGTAGPPLADRKT